VVRSLDDVVVVVVVVEEKKKKKERKQPIVPLGCHSCDIQNMST